MLVNNQVKIGIVFFCSVGWICSDRAIGANDAGSGVFKILKTVVQNVVAQQANPPTADVEPQNAAPDSLFNEPEAAITSVEVEEAISDQSLAMGEYGQIDIHVKDLAITKVLQLLSIQSHRNIVASRNVTGAISADLYGVDFYEAMVAILHPNGFGYEEKGNFIYVYTAEELSAIAEANQQVVVKVIKLNYIPAADAVEFIKPLLSEGGSISVSAKMTPGFQPTMSDAGDNAFAHRDTLLVRDFQDNVAQIDDVLRQLDTRPAQVLIEATILEARLTEENAFGVDMTLLGDFGLETFGNPLSTIDNLIDGTVEGNSGHSFESTVGQTDDGSAGLRLGFISSDLAIFVKALDSITDTTVLANPKVLVLNRHRAELLVGERLGYISTVQTETSQTQTVEFLDIGTELTVRPFVSDDGFIRMELRPSISDGSTSLVGGFVIPNTNNEEMITNILVRNGQTVVMGGLFKEDTEIDRRQVPWLGDIPILGTPFRGQDDRVNRSEVIFLIKPTIVKDKVLFAEAERIKQNVELARIGARQELLPWSRSKMVAGHMREALEHQEAGDSERALWAVNMALMLDPMFVEGRRLKEELAGNRIDWPYRSMLKDALDHVIEEKLRTPDDTMGQEPIAPKGMELASPEDRAAQTPNVDVVSFSDSPLQDAEESASSVEVDTEP